MLFWFGISSCDNINWSYISHFYQHYFRHYYYPTTVTFLSLTIENTPEATQTISAMFTLPVYFRTPLGETKMPDPIIEPTITVTPFSRLILAFRPVSPSPLSPPPFAGASTSSKAPPFNCCNSTSFSLPFPDPFVSLLRSDDFLLTGLSSMVVRRTTCCFLYKYFCFLFSIWSIIITDLGTLSSRYLSCVCLWWQCRCYVLLV